MSECLEDRPANSAVPALPVRWGPVSACVVLTVISGCAVLGTAGAYFGAEESGREKPGVGNPLPTIAIPQDAIQLEIAFAERPVGDPLLGDALWREIGEVGAIAARVRHSLEANGIRVGHCSSSPPRALETLLGLDSDADAKLDETAGLNARRVTLRSGGETEIQTSYFFPECTISVPGTDGNKTKSFEHARCVFRVKAQKLQDGWARLEFQPEVHSGQSRVRTVAGKLGWELKTQQEIEPLFTQKFSVTLNLGEMAVISAHDAEPESLGRHFFQRTGETGTVQHVLVVRLSKVASEDPVRGE